MKKGSLVFLMLSCFMLGSNITSCVMDKEEQEILCRVQKYNEQKRLEVIKESVNQANLLLKNRHKEFLNSKVKFRASEFGVSLTFQ